MFCCSDRSTGSAGKAYCQHCSICNGISYRSFTEQYFDSCGIFRDAVIAILVTVAKQERIRISERVRAGLITARNKGKRLGCPRVFISRCKIESLRQAGKS